ncbi:MAG TPA: hypothetical protein VLG28_07905 [Acidimicrobiia bacterium]|jgi:hypothetical protein|nr:hypothetical protein [Acidimicrobiia bacterium]
MLLPPESFRIAEGTGRVPEVEFDRAERWGEDLARMLGDGFGAVAAG